MNDVKFSCLNIDGHVNDKREMVVTVTIGLSGWVYGADPRTPEPIFDPFLEGFDVEVWSDIRSDHGRVEGYVLRIVLTLPFTAKPDVNVDVVEIAEAYFGRTIESMFDEAVENSYASWRVTKAHRVANMAVKHFVEEIGKEAREATSYFDRLSALKAEVVAKAHQIASERREEIISDCLEHEDMTEAIGNLVADKVLLADEQDYYSGMRGMRAVDKDPITEDELEKLV